MAFKNHLVSGMWCWNVNVMWGVIVSIRYVVNANSVFKWVRLLTVWTEYILDLRGPNSCFRAPKSMRETTPELNGSIKDKKSVLKFWDGPLLVLQAALTRVPGLQKMKRAPRGSLWGPLGTQGPSLYFSRLLTTLYKGPVGLRGPLVAWGARMKGSRLPDSVYADPGAHANS